MAQRKPETYRRDAGGGGELPVRRTGSWELNTKVGWIVVGLWPVLLVAGGIGGYLHPAEDALGIGLLLGLLSILPVAFGSWFIYAKLYLPSLPPWRISWRAGEVRLRDDKGVTQKLIDLNQPHGDYLLYAAESRSAYLRIEADPSGGSVSLDELMSIVARVPRPRRAPELELAGSVSFEPGLGSSLASATVFAPYVAVGDEPEVVAQLDGLLEHLAKYDEARRTAPVLPLDDGRVATLLADRIRVRAGSSEHDYPLAEPYQLIARAKHQGGKNQVERATIALVFRREGVPPLRFELNTLSKHADGIDGAWPDDVDPGGGDPLPGLGDSPEALFAGRALLQLLQRAAPELALTAFVATRFS